MDTFVHKHLMLTDRAAGLLRQLAPSQRKQGAYIGTLLEQAAAVPIAAKLADLERQLRELRAAVEGREVP